MSFFHIALSVFAWLIALAWLLKLVEAARGLATIPNLLAPEYDVAPLGSPSVTVIVPARNEAESVAECVESLVRQDCANLRVLAVNDRSTDATGTILSALADASHGRLEVLTITELPTNWLGKTHAMAVAAHWAMEAHGTDYLLFTDADIVFSVEAIRRAVAYASTTNADHFVLLPTTIVKTWGEGMLLAYLQVMSLWAVRTWLVADGNAKRDAIGVGAFNLILTSAYVALGGFEAARMEILEDLDLGRRVKRAGLRQRIATAPGMVRVHWAAGALGIVTGMTKNLFAVFRYRSGLLVAAATGLAIFCVAPAMFLAIRSTRTAGLAIFASVAGLYVLSGRTSRISAMYSLTHPIAGAIVVYSMLRSMTVTLARGGVRWRGTFYALDELRSYARRKQ